MFTLIRKLVQFIAGQKYTLILLRLAVSLAVCLTLGHLVFAQGRSVRNSNLNAKGAAFTFTQEHLEKLRANGWTCPDLKDWPTWWTGHGSNMKVEYLTTGGKDNSPFLRISGTDGLVAGYYAYPFEEPTYILTVWARGKGTLRAGVLAFRLSSWPADHKEVIGMVSLPPLVVKLNTDKWIQYQHILRKGDMELSVHPAFSAEGTVDFDDVDIKPSSPGLDLIVEEKGKLYGTGALIENMDVVKVDEVFVQKRAEYESALKDFRSNSSKFDKKLVESMEKEIATLNPYVFTKYLTVIEVTYYNKMIAMTGVLKRLAGKNPEKAATIKSVADYKPGVRHVRPGTVTITAIEPNLILYEENEDASVKATIVNRAATAQKGVLIALMHLDLDTVREIKREPVTIAANGTKIWRFNYNVGPETYGRGIEVRFVDENGKLIDSWQEFYQVAAEWLRVQMHTCSSRYNNMLHYFASEPTDFGVHSIDVEEYLSGQEGYHIYPEARRRRNEHYQKKGKKFTFYQNTSFSGIMGYEEMRKHPEYVLYDETGQFARDPFYGGYPNPMELASPIEIGPKRKAEKPYLNRMYTAWQHRSANLANEDALRYGVNRIKKYAEEQGFDGVFLDALLSAMKGYDYQGKPTLPTDKKEIARLNARIANIYQGILKEENPYFGTWFNLSRHGTIEFFRSLGRVESTLGSGVDVGGVDVSDEWIRAMTGWKNTSFLFELQHAFLGGAGFDRFPAKLLTRLLENRDYLVQKYGANVITGYITIPIDLKEPGPSKWGWPTINWFMAMITATQHRLVSWGMPSFEPSFQFKTRYSRFLWARDIRAVPVDEVERTVQITSPEKIWWNRLVYKRKTKDGYDLIVHLVRIPPTERWDINWRDEPPPLEGVKITVDLGSGALQDVQSARPYHFEEEQQPVQKIIQAVSVGNKIIAEVPPFRYYTMVVFRVKTM